MVASSAPLDQFVVRHPSYFFDASPEHALVNPDNLQILVDHIKCAAFELPFTTTETYGRENLQEILGVLSEEGFVHLSKPGAAEDATGHWHWTNESYPADAVSLRTVSSDNFVVVDKTDTTRVIGETDFNTALEILHEKAIYIVEGRLYQVEELDFEGRKRSVGTSTATTTPTPSRTAASRRSTPRRRQASGRARCPPTATSTSCRASWVQENQVLHQRERRIGRAGPARAPDAHDVVLADDVPRELMTALPYSGDDRRDGVVGMSHAMRQVAQLLLMCDARDIGVSIAPRGKPRRTGRRRPPRAPPRRGARRSSDGDEPRVFIYDNYPGGIGFSEPLFPGCTPSWPRGRANSSPAAPASPAARRAWGPLGDVGARAKEVATRHPPRDLTVASSQ